jgi:hypothetical protein
MVVLYDRNMRHFLGCVAFNSSPQDRSEWPSRKAESSENSKRVRVIPSARRRGNCTGFRKRQYVKERRHKDKLFVPEGSLREMQSLHMCGLLVLPLLDHYIRTRRNQSFDVR